MRVCSFHLPSPPLHPLLHPPLHAALPGKRPRHPQHAFAPPAPVAFAPSALPLRVGRASPACDAHPPPPRMSASAGKPPGPPPRPPPPPSSSSSGGPGRDGDTDPHAGADGARAGPGGPGKPGGGRADGEMQVYNRKGRQRDASGDLLPFDVSVVTPPPRRLGQFRLDARTHCGDIVEHDGAHFVVKSVRIRYKLLGGRYQVIGKAIEVKSLARKAIETYLERKFQDS